MSGLIPQKILIIRISSMGDVILVTALFAALTKRSPGSEITFITDLQYVELFKDDSRLGRVVGICKKSGISDPALLEMQWDLVIDLQGNRRSKALLNLIKHKKRLGVFRKQHLKRSLKLLARVDFYSEKEQVVKRYFEAAGIGDDSCDPEPCRLFCESPVLSVDIKQTMHTGGIVRPIMAMIPFAAWKNKEWPGERFVKVGQFFHLKGWDVCILGGPEEKDRASAMAEEVGQRCFSLAGKISLYECGCFLKKCSLALGNDTGLSHMARACGVRTGVIYGPTIRQWGFYPYGEPPFRIFESSWFCRPCHAHGGNVCFFSKACMKKISSDYVIRGLVELAIG